MIGEDKGLGGEQSVKITMSGLAVHWKWGKKHVLAAFVCGQWDEIHVLGAFVYRQWEGIYVLDAFAYRQ